MLEHAKNHAPISGVVFLLAILCQLIINKACLLMKYSLLEFKDKYWEQSKGMLALFLFFTIAISYFSSRYTFAYNGAISDCLKVKFLLVDTWNKDVKRGDLAAFYMNKENKLFPKGMKWFKKVGAHGGDIVNVTYDDMTVNNSIHYNINLWYTLSKLKMDMSEITQHVEVESNELFMIGETPTSYDSRFWGPIEQSDVIGVAYAIF